MELMKPLTPQEFFDAVHDPKDEDRKSQLKDDNQTYIIVRWNMTPSEHADKKFTKDLSKAMSMLIKPEAEEEEMKYHGNLLVYVHGDGLKESEDVNVVEAVSPFVKKRLPNFTEFMKESVILEDNIDEGESVPDYLRSIRVEQNGKKETIDMKKNMVNDGGTPNLFFVTSTNNCMYKKSGEEWKYYYESITSMKEAPLKLEDHLITTVYGPFEDPKKAIEKADSIDLLEDTGPRQVLIEDRNAGTVYERVLKVENKLVWQDEVVSNDLSA